MRLDELEELYRSRFEVFARVAASVTGDPDRARDVVQEGFATAVRERRSFRGEGSLEAWVWRIVLNTARSDVRRAAPAIDDGGIFATNGHPEQHAELRGVLARLPERQRTAVFLRYYADLDYAAIATALGISTGTVAATLYAAHARGASHPTGGDPNVIDFDRTSLDRILPRTVGSADWGDVLIRSGAHEARRSRFVVLAAAAVVLVVGTASAFAVRAALDIGRPELPPRAAAPSRPATGTPVLRYAGMPGFGGANEVLIYADGRVIWRGGRAVQSVAGVRTGFLEKRVTPEAVERLRSAVLATGLFSRHRAFTSAKLTRYGAIAARTGGRLVRVVWCCRPDGAPPLPGARVATRTQALTINRLTKLLANPMSVLPRGSGLKDPKLRAYIPARYAVCYSGGVLHRDGGTHGERVRPASILSSLPHAARELVRGKTRTYPDPTFRYSSPLRGINEPRRSYACSELTTKEARALQEILTEAGYERRGLTLTVPAESALDPNARLRAIEFVPILPHGEPFGPMGG